MPSGDSPRMDRFLEKDKDAAVFRMREMEVKQMQESTDQTLPKMMERPEGKQVMGAVAAAPNGLERAALLDLDINKINDLAECLFVLNNRRYGPIPGAYMVVCVQPNEQWCVGQLNADRAKPFILFEDKVFSTPELAQAEAENMKLVRGEMTPPRRCT